MRRELALRPGVCAFFCIVTGVAVARFGSTPEHYLYQVLLLLLAPAVIAVWRSTRLAEAAPSVQILSALGVALLANTALHPTAAGPGFALASIAWAGVVISRWLAAEVRSARWLFFFLIGLGALEAAYGLGQAVGELDRIDSYARGADRIATGTFVNRNHFAGLLNMTIGLVVGALYAGFAQRGRRRRSETVAWTWLVILACSVLGLALALSLSRAGALVLVVVLLFVFLLLRRTGGRRRKRLPASVAAIALASTLVLTLAYGADDLTSRFARIAAGDRLQVYADTLKLIGDHPLRGVGPGMFRWRFPAYQTTSVEKLYRHAHNDYLQTAAEWGIPLALGVWTFVVWRFYRAIRTFVEARDAWRGGMALGVAAAMLSILLHSLVDFNLQIPSNLLVFASIVGIGWAIDPGSRPEVVVRRERRNLAPEGLSRMLLALVVIAALGTSWTVGRRLLAVEIARRQPTLGGLERAVRWDRSNPDLHLQLARRHRVESAVGHLEKAIASTEAAVELAPFDWRAHWQLAQLHEVTGRRDKAEEALLRAVELNPENPAYQWRLANFFLRSGRSAQFYDPARRALASDRSLLRAAFGLMTKANLPAEGLDRVWPPDRDASLSLIDLLRRLEPSALEDRYLPLFLDRWRTVMADQRPPSLVEGASLIAGLLKIGRSEEARRQWTKLARANGLEDRLFADGRNRIWNGSFELPISGSGLDWTARGRDGVAFATVPSDRYAGELALAVTSAGTRSPSFLGLQQRVVVEPGSRYRFSFESRTDGLPSDRRPYFEFRDPMSGRIVHRTEEARGSGEWREQASTFEVPPDVSMLVVRLRQIPDRQPGGRVTGSLLLDHLVVSPASEDAVGP